MEVLEVCSYVYLRCIFGKDADTFFYDGGGFGRMQFLGGQRMFSFH